MSCLTNFSIKIKEIIFLILAFAVGGCVLGGRGNVRTTAVFSYAASPASALVAVLPPVNLSGVPLSSYDFRRRVTDRLTRGGYRVLGNADLEAFMGRHRMRYTGGLSTELSEALRAETGATLALITQIGLHSEESPPKMALFARLVETGHQPTVRWMNGVAFSGDDSPGFLSLGLIEEMDILRPLALDALLNPLVTGGVESAPATGASFAPAEFHRASGHTVDESATVAVLPFVNKTKRLHAGELMALHVVEQLSRSGRCSPVEPGRIRDCLLRARLIMPAGISNDEAVVIFPETEADYIVSGSVLAYDDYEGWWGDPAACFSIQIVNRNNNQIVWSSVSDLRGGENAGFFDIGKQRTAHGLASRMVAEVIGRWISER